MSDAIYQRAVLAPVPQLGHYLVFGLVDDCDPRPGLLHLRDVHPDGAFVVGLGEPLVRRLGGSIPGLRTFPALSGTSYAMPSTQGALWIFLSGNSDPGALLLRGRHLRSVLGDAYRLEEDVPAFKFAEGRDLSGYVDGTENPTGEKATATAIIAGAGPGLDGGSFVAVQRYVHDLTRFQRMHAPQRDAAIGRRQDTDEELKDAPLTSHVKRSAQEDFDPPAFMLRRSMPWGNVGEHGLYFVAYGATLDPFERVLKRMAGLDDGIVDAVLTFSRAVSGGYYFCPPVRDQKLDLRALGL